jgi:hypothetical protein
MIDCFRTSIRLTSEEPWGGGDTIALEPNLEKSPKKSNNKKKGGNYRFIVR